jgi:hypothetical protein
MFVVDQATLQIQGSRQGQGGLGNKTVLCFGLWSSHTLSLLTTLTPTVDVPVSGATTIIRLRPKCTASQLENYCETLYCLSNILLRKKIQISAHYTHSHAASPFIFIELSQLIFSFIPNKRTSACL